MNPVAGVIVGAVVVVVGYLLWGIVLAAGDLANYWTVDMSTSRYESASLRQIACGLGYGLLGIIGIVTALYVVGTVTLVVVGLF